MYFTWKKTIISTALIFLRGFKFLSTILRFLEGLIAAAISRRNVVQIFFLSPVN